MTSLAAEDIEAILSSKLKHNNFKVVSCSNLDTSDMPIGFLSNQEKVLIEYITDGRNEKLYTFVKKMPTSAFRRDIVLAGGGFRKEVSLFQKFLIGVKEKLEGNQIPTCYLARPDSIVVLNDLSREGFKNYPLLEPLPEDHVKKTLEALAILHAASITFEKKNGVKMIDHIPILQEEPGASPDKVNVTRSVVVAGINTIRNVARKHLPQFDTDLVERVLSYMENMFKDLKPSPKYQNVINHSDLWGNNVMFSYDDEGNVKEASLVDFQLAVYRTPAYDLLFFLHCCTGKELRDEKLPELLKHYYTHLGNQLKSEGIDINDVFTWAEFEDILEESRPQLLPIATLTLNFVLMPDYIIRDILQDEVKYAHYFNVDKTEVTLQAIDECPQYNKRLLEGLSEIFEYFKNNKDL